MNKLAITLGVAVLLGSTGCGNRDETEGSSSKAEAQAPAEASNAVAAGDHSLPGDPEAGAEVYGRICVACHGADGTGNGGITGADFVHDESRLSKSNEELLTSIENGIPNNPPMPPQGDNLSEQERKDALSYIRREFGQQD